MPLIPDQTMGGVPPDAGGGLPPELMQLLQGAAAGPQGPAQPPVSPAEGDVDPLEHLRLAIEHAQAALVSEPDDTDSQALAKIVQGLYAILAAREKETQQALGGNPSQMRALGRAYG